ncbi:GTPase RsgA [Paenibacillus sp. NFR01]|uniref:GTPase RsgA n=1 Tax=Paenibacillus sp. NFR01 TaxID=1566279 RepID=UPI001C315989|nr:GTPase RsgA [Paenibacillus sp. NFR01]
MAFVGSSGVGKSTLINRLIGQDVLKKEAIRKDDAKGRHTTTHRQLLLLPTGGNVRNNSYSDNEDFSFKEYSMHSIGNNRTENTVRSSLRQLKEQIL